MTPIELKVLLYLFGMLLAILGFIGALAVHALIRMSKDITEIKTALKLGEYKFNDHEERIDNLEGLLNYKKN